MNAPTLATSLQRPAVLPNGAYDPFELDQFLSQVVRQKIPDPQAAWILRVPVHRLVYFLRDGRARIRAQADAEKKRRAAAFMQRKPKP
jgi:hypothetical protein